MWYVCGLFCKLWTLIETSIRELKAKVAVGETVTVKIHKRAVARIIPIKPSARIVDLAKVPGIKWNGGKPEGLARAETMRKGVTLSDWVSQDRR